MSQMLRSAPILDALYRVIVAHPEDDAPRLAFADALQGIDDDRASFIRAQVKVSQVYRSRWLSPDYGDLSILEQSLLSSGAPALEPVRGRVDKQRLKRGFVEAVWLDARRFLGDAADLFERAPILDVNLTGVAAVARELFASPHLARLRSLDLSDNGLDDDAAVALAGSPHLEKLAWLDLSKNKISAKGLDALAASQRLPRLGYLCLADNLCIDPTPRIGGCDDYGNFDLEYPAAGRELAARHGERAWLTTSSFSWPPEREAV